MYNAALDRNEAIEKALAIYEPDSLLLTRNAILFKDEMSIKFHELIQSGELVPDGSPLFKMRWMLQQAEGNKLQHSVTATEVA
jgi:hypothetical protein